MPAIAMAAKYVNDSLLCCAAPKAAVLRSCSFRRPASTTIHPVGIYPFQASTHTCSSKLCLQIVAQNNQKKPFLRQKEDETEKKLSFIPDIFSKPISQIIANVSMEQVDVTEVVEIEREEVEDGKYYLIKKIDCKLISAVALVSFIWFGRESLPRLIQFLKENPTAAALLGTTAAAFWSFFDSGLSSKKNKTRSKTTRTTTIKKIVPVPEATTEGKED